MQKNSTLKKSEKLVSEIINNQNVKAQQTLESIFREKLEKRVKEIKDREG